MLLSFVLHTGILALLLFRVHGAVHSKVLLRKAQAGGAPTADRIGRWSLGFDADGITKVCNDGTQCNVPRPGGVLKRFGRSNRAENEITAKPDLAA